MLYLEHSNPYPYRIPCIVSSAVVVSSSHAPFDGACAGLKENSGYMASPPHIAWLKDTGQTLSTASGEPVRILEFAPAANQAVLSEWARYFREHYCLDTVLDEAREGTGLSRKQYLTQLVFPDKSIAPGPSTRVGDFAEILVADYIEYIQGWTVPRTRYRMKSSANESTRGTDILAFRLTETTNFEKKIYSPQDILMSVEVKAQFTGTKAKPRLQDAINDSAKDQLRRAMSLNAMKRRLQAESNAANAKLVERFQNLADRPYQVRYTAAAFHCVSNFADSAVSGATTVGHPERSKLSLLLIKGSTMMQLVNQVYEVAANEA